MCVSQLYNDRKVKTNKSQFIELNKSELMEELKPQEREIIRLRYGLGAVHPLTQREIAQQCGISRSYVSRIEKKALEKLKAALESELE